MRVLMVACASCDFLWHGTDPVEGISAVRTHRRECPVETDKRRVRFLYTTVQVPESPEEEK